MFAIISIVYGVLKKRDKFWKIGAIVFALAVIGAFYFGYQYTRLAIDYVRSKDFQSDVQKGSELVGETIGSITSGASEGLASTLEDSSIAKLAGQSGLILGKSIKTIAAGLDSTLGEKNVFIDSLLEAEGLQIGRAEEEFKDGKSVLSFYIESTKDFKSKVAVTNYDRAGKIIERSEKQVILQSGKGQVEKFTFNNSDFGLTTYFIVSKVK